MIRIHVPSRYKVSSKKISLFAQKYLEKNEVGHFLVNIIFVGKRKMTHIATTYKHENVALPVLSFPFKEPITDGEEIPLLGEVFLCYPQVVLLAAERGKTVDHMVEQLVEHGIHNILQ